ncbi:MAG: RidA family protein [Candidatus Moranbacteria bacterium]|nr:RidA family protein [Candidatus Moranbacteria bacterium]
MTKEFIVPKNQYKSGRAYTPAIRFDDGVSETIYISGLLPKDAEGKVVGIDDIEAQARCVFDKMIAILEEAGADLNDLVKVNMYLVHFERDFEKVSAVRNEYLMESRPAATTVGITATATEGCDIEIDAIAMKRK